MTVSKPWKKGRGKLGVFTPLLGTWVADADSPQGPVHCVRTFSKTLADSHIQLTAVWTFGDTVYEELALFGRGGDKQIRFWSFTSDGKQSTGVLSDAGDIHPEAVGFEAHMDAGLARQVYWPDGEGGFHWVVESHRRNGWLRFVEHHYHPSVEGGAAI